MIEALLFGLGVLLGLFLAYFFNYLQSPVVKETVQIQPTKPNEETNEDWEDESEGEDSDDQLQSDIKFLEQKGYDEVMAEKYPMNDIKMVLAVRNDLAMGKGKIGAQSGHATLGVYQQTKRWGAKSTYWKNILKTWSVVGQKKICVKVNSEQEILDLQKKAAEVGVPTYLVADAGHTQIEAGSLTVLGLGPVTTKQVNLLTGHMKLL